MGAPGFNLEPTPAAGCASRGVGRRLSCSQRPAPTAMTTAHGTLPPPSVAAVELVPLPAPSPSLPVMDFEEFSSLLCTGYVGSSSGM
uniref:Uncharacterized protein n=1 Tax=Oryza meridionalis TaxID=40149 RepID=A0A0E0DN79_9ORYZ